MKEYAESVQKISETLRQNLYNLFNEIIEVYTIDCDNKKLSILEINRNKYISYICNQNIAQLSMSHSQSDFIFSNIDKLHVIEGERYCFITMMMNSILNNYSLMNTFLMSKKYLSSETLEHIKFFYDFILSEEFQLLKVAFKTSECYTALEEKQTFH
jgi:hypothetical protein